MLEHRHSLVELESFVTTDFMLRFHIEIEIDIRMRIEIVELVELLECP